MLSSSPVLGRFAAFVLAAFPTAVAADPVAEFYKDKQMTIIVGTAPGGDYDTWARMIGRHFAKHIPGRPEIIVQNMPGAGGIRATNFVYNVAPKDGTVVAMTSRNAPFRALTGDKIVRFNPTKVHWLGSPEVTNRVCIVSNRAPIKSAKEILQTEIILAGSGQGSALSTIPVMLNRLIGSKFRLVEGYHSATDAKLAMDRGEVHGLCQSYTQIARAHADELKSGAIRVLFTMEERPIPGVAAPSIYEFTTDDKQRQVLTLFSTGVVLGRPMFAPPGTPSDRVTALRRAYGLTLNDAALKAEAKKLGLVVTLTSGEEITRIVEKLMATPPEIRDIAGSLGN